MLRAPRNDLARRMRPLRATGRATYGHGRSPSRAGLITGSDEPSRAEICAPFSETIRFYDPPAADLSLCFAVTPPTACANRAVSRTERDDEPPGGSEDEARHDQA